jgi:predicted nucleic acid-binding protein
MKKSIKSSTRAETFLDTSGFYALLVRGDAAHARATALLKKAAHAGSRFVTTDYVLDETATLLKARGCGHLVAALFDTVFASAACRVEWMDPDAFAQTREFFQKHHDQAWSFTDCFSFRVMRLLGLLDALTTDNHFREAGFRPLLA